MLIKRNLLLFFRDKANVFFSLLAVFIIIGLYVLFLGDVMVASLRESLGFDSDKINVVMVSITLAGMVAVTSVTSCMGALGISVEDKSKISGDFLTSPVSRGKITLGYMLGSAGVSMIMTVVALILCMVYIVSNGGAIPTAYDGFRLLLTTILSVLCGNSIVYLVSIFVKSVNAFSALSTVLGTLIGFIMGIYIPIGSLPGPVQWVIKCFPMSHAASMYRQIMADEPLAELFNGAPAGTLEEFREMFGITYRFGDASTNFWISAAILCGTIVLFYALSLIVSKLKRD